MTHIQTQRVMIATGFDATSNFSISVFDGAQITSTTVQGTFQGTVKSAGRPDIAISNGEFKVKRVN